MIAVDRHRLLGVLTTNSSQMIFSDTPGMLALPAYRLQEVMVESVRGAAGDADVLLVVTDVFGEPLLDAKVRDNLQAVAERRAVVVVVNKMDLIADLSPAEARARLDPNITTLEGLARKRQRPSAPAPAEYASPRSFPELEALWRRRVPGARVLGVSAAHQVNVTALLDAVRGLLPPGPKYFPSDTLTNRDERFFCTEIIRETLFHSYSDEVPYSCEVTIGSFADKSPTLSVIEAFIVVRRRAAACDSYGFTRAVHCCRSTRRVRRRF